MIELPESYVLVDQLSRTLKGKVIRSAEADHTHHAFAGYTGKPGDYNGRLAGKTITSADVFGGNIRIKADDMVMIISTPIRFHQKDEKLPEKYQLRVEFEDSTSITCTVQMWGGMFCFREGDPDGLPEQFVVSTNPSPLEDIFNEAFFKAMLAKEKLSSLSAKAFLATEQRIPGLGNGVLQDVLWTARIHPKRKMSALNEGELKALFEAVKSVPAQMAEQGGRDTERDLFGCPGGYRTVLSKNTVNKPCPVCNTIIKKEAYLGGSIYYCEKCQKK